MDLGKRIKQRREQLNMSQDELARKLGYKSRSSINKIELGKNDITQHKIAEFAKALQTTPAYLMGWIEEKAEKKNDIISDIILRLRTDENFLAVVTDLYNISDKQLTAVKTMLDALKE